MDASIILSAILSPFILFFFLGYVLIFVKSDVRIPPDMSQGMSLFILIAIGLGGGVKVAEALVKNPAEVHMLIPGSIFAIATGIILAVIAFFITLKIIGLDISNAGAVAAHNGAVSTSTMVLGVAFLAEMPFESLPFAVVLYPFMDSPALITGIVLALFFLGREGRSENAQAISIGKMIFESFTGRAVILIFSGVVIGVVAGMYSPKATKEVMVLFDGLFKGVLCLFLMEMGMVAAARIGELWHERKKMGNLIIYAMLFPFVAGTVVLLAGWVVGLNPYFATFLAIIGASSSYVSAPAACRTALPKANPSLYLGQSLGIIFPLNIMVNIPFVLLPLSRALFT